MSGTEGGRLRATEVLERGSWSSEPADRVTLNYDDRFRRRVAMRGEGGLAFLLDLAKAQELRQGDGLRLADGRIVEVAAAPEPLLDIRCRDQHHLVRVAWHLGNRHLPTQIFEDRLRIRQDHVIEEMTRLLGAEVVKIEAPFDPEGGAYGHGRTQPHDHGPATDHSHEHAHDHTHGHSRDHDHQH